MGFGVGLGSKVWVGFGTRFGVGSGPDWVNVRGWGYVLVWGVG